MPAYTHWTEQMHQYLVNNYQTKGDKELSILFQKKFPKNHQWTIKHIEKHRYHFNLKRTPEQIRQIKKRNFQIGLRSNEKTWQTRGRSPEGTIKVWKGRQYIKHNGKFELYPRAIMQGLNPNQIVRTHDGKTEIITRAENAARNSKQRLNWPPELKLAINAINKLKKLTHA